ncbi:DUF998 domain-containing protein [Propionicimonas paludicola]
MMVGSLSLMTWRQREFLSGLGWSPTHRNPIQWPSILLLGPDGWIVGLTFVTCGLLVILFSAFVFRSDRGRLIRAASIMLGATGVVLTLLAIPPVPRAAVQWASLHDLIYPLLPLAWIASAVLLSLGIGSNETWRTVRNVSVALLVMFLFSLLLTGVPQIAQLARNFAFGAQLAWLSLLSIAFAARASSDTPSGLSRR